MAKPRSWPAPRSPRTNTSPTGRRARTPRDVGKLVAERFIPTPEGDLREVCVGTGKKSDLQHSLDRPRVTGDTHGQGPMLWTATALLR